MSVTSAASVLSSFSARSRRRVLQIAIGSLGSIALFSTVAIPQVAAANAPVGLGSASSFAVLAGTTVTNTGASTIAGDLGLSPGSAVVGFPPGTVTGGVIHAADAPAGLAKVDLAAAYDDAASRATSEVISADLAGRTLIGGVYTGSTLGLTGSLTLDAQGDPSTVFVFQSASTLIATSGSSVALVNGANPCNVFWQVGSSATIGTGAQFSGTVLALTSISAQTGAVITGRLLARNGAVTLDTNTITRPDCATLAPGASTTTTLVSTSTLVPGAAATTSTVAAGAGTTTTAVGATLPGPTPSSFPVTGTLPATGPGSGSTTVGLMGALVILVGGTGILAARRSRGAEHHE